MVLTNKQEEGLKIAVARYNAKEAWTCIAGYAGTGKSTLVKFIVSALNIDPDYVCYVAFTGKASLVLKEKGCSNAMTAHRLLYQSYPKKDGTFYHRPKPVLDFPYKLIIVDEISMLPKEMWELLLKHKIHVIALGDPGQLPPIGEDNGILAKPHIFLDEIMRQAQESEIIRLTMDIRDNKPLQLFNGKEVQIIDKRDLVSGMYTWADQILVGKNDTRRIINQLIRDYKYQVGTDTRPIENDKVICLRNDWESINDYGDMMVNGTLGYITNLRTSETANPWVKPELTVDFVPEERVNETERNPYFKDLTIDYKLMVEGEPTVNKHNFMKIPKPFRPKEFDYGYCITTHKSQGSEYNKVLVLEEYLRGGDHARWLYTAATRAKDKLVIVRDYR